jgi:hypothetical protein
MAINETIELRVDASEVQAFLDHLKSIVDPLRADLGSINDRMNLLELYVKGLRAREQDRDRREALLKAA